MVAIDKVAASSQNQALNALVFLYREVLRIRTVQELLRHNDVSKTMMYTHVAALRVRSPLDGIGA